MLAIARLFVDRVLLRAAPSLVKQLARGRALIFMLHRFEDRENGIAGHDPLLLRSALSYLRRHRYELVSIEEVFRRVAFAPHSLSKTVAFTMDDGYKDQAIIGGPLFAEFDCPVTTFVTTGFIDREHWLWWDQLDYVFRYTKRQSLSLPIGDQLIRVAWNNDTKRNAIWRAFVESCKDLSHAAKSDTIHRLAAEAEVEIPQQPPPQYASMTWSELRKCENAGMKFGAHTVSHPILSLMSDEEARREIVESWKRLQSETKHPVPVFCYPNGRKRDFGPREIEVLKELNFLGAVTSVAGYASALPLSEDSSNRYAVPRFDFPSYRLRFLRYVSGIERLMKSHPPLEAATMWSECLALGVQREVDE